jgi:hypothetical protein
MGAFYKVFKNSNGTYHIRHIFTGKIVAVDLSYKNALHQISVLEILDGAKQMARTERRLKNEITPQAVPDIVRLVFGIQ